MRPKALLRVASNGAISKPNIGPSCRNPSCPQTGSRKSCGPSATSSRSKASPNSRACSVESSKPLIECSDVPNPVQPSPEPHPASLVQHPPRSPKAVSAGAASGHSETYWTGRPGSPVSNGPDPTGSERRTRDRDPGRGAASLCAVAADAVVSRAPFGKVSGYAGQDLIQIRRRQPGRL